MGEIGPTMCAMNNSINTENYVEIYLLRISNLSILQHFLIRVYNHQGTQSPGIENLN